MEIGEALIQIADKLGISVQHVYELFVSVQAARGMLIIVQVIAFLMGAYLILGWAQKKYVKDGSSNGEELFFGIWVRIIVYLFSIIIIGDVIGDAILQIMYPEYCGAKELIEVLLKFR